MATVAPIYEDRSMSIGRVFQRAFAAIKLNPVAVLGLALVVGAVPGVVMTYFSAQLGLGSPNALRTGAVSPRSFFGMIMVSSFIGLLVSALVQGALTRAVVSANEGRKVSIGECLAGAVRVVLPLIGLSILWALGVGVGFMLLVVPGIILLLMWSVAIPSLVVERRGVVNAFGRSRELTSGARWKIFGLLLVIMIIYWLFTLLVSAIGLGMYKATNPNGFTTTNLIGGLIVGTLFNMMWGTIQPSLYVELRQWKEGGSVENLEEVFA